MPKMRKKSDLPRKICAGCGLPFTWRRKWARDWPALRYCSDRCRKGATVRGAASCGRRASAVREDGGLEDLPGKRLAVLEGPA